MIKYNFQIKEQQEITIPNNRMELFKIYIYNIIKRVDCNKDYSRLISFLNFPLHTFRHQIQVTETRESQTQSVSYSKEQMSVANTTISNFNHLGKEKQLNG